MIVKPSSKITYILMKILYIYLLWLLPTLLLTACDNEMAAENVPEKVKSGLYQQFPDVRVLEWERIDQNYVAEFNIKNIPYEVMISPDGQVVQYKYDILETELPQAVRETVRKNYAEVPIANAEILMHGGKKYYQLAFDGDARDYWLVFSEDGQKLDRPKYMK
ncbi:hypothetical protein D770_02130 [Flammeovirgaceae bacterium 311]|nr:hypothetical protein D770_02130 [Flammeovirgaceae bacterium 311]